MHLITRIRKILDQFIIGITKLLIICSNRKKLVEEKRNFFIRQLLDPLKMILRFGTINFFTNRDFSMFNHV